MPTGSYLLAHAHTIHRKVDQKERKRSTPMKATGYGRAVLCVFLPEELYLGDRDCEGDFYECMAF